MDELCQQHGADPAKLFRQIKPPKHFQIIQTHNYNDDYIEKYHEIIVLACARLSNRITVTVVLEAVESLITS